MDNGELKELIRGVVKEENQAQREKINAIHRAMVGTVDGEKKGLVPRVASLEKANDKRTKLELAGLIALLALVGKAAWELIVK